MAVRLASVILAGGRSRRMGRPKASLPIAGTSVLLRTVETLLDCTWPVVVAARDEHQELPPLHTECDVLYDLRPGEGPLAGVETALRWLAEDRADAAFVCGCDQPFLTSAAVTRLADRLHTGDRALVCAPGGRVHPLCSIWRVDCFEDAAHLLADGERSLKALADRVHARRIEETTLRELDPELSFLQGINTPEEYDAARARLERD